MNNKKKLLIYSDCYIFGGSEQMMLSIISNQIVKEEYEIHFAYRNHQYYKRGLGEQYGLDIENFHPLFVLSNDTLFYKIRKLKCSSFIKNVLMFPLWCLQRTGLYSIYNFFVITSLVRKINPDIVHINNGGYPGAKSCGIAVFAAKMKKIKNIIYQVNNRASKKKNKFSKWFDENVINKNVTYFVTGSKEAREILSQNRGFNLDKIIQLPNTILDRPVIKNREQLLSSLSLSDNVFLVCQVAFLSKRKGQAFLIEAVKKIESLEPELFKYLRVVFVGDGEDELALKNIVQNNNLTSHIFFTGYRSDYFDFINACDVFVLPSISSEDMPLVVLEAMNRTKTIIASNFAGIKEEIEDSVSGILVEPNPITLAQDIAEAIIYSYTHRSMNDYGMNAKKRFDDYFSSREYGKRLLEIYKLAADKKNN